MKFDHVIHRVCAPAVLPVFDPAWKTECRTCKHLITSDPDLPWGCAAPGAVAPKRFGKPKRKPHACGDARDLGQGGKCGPNALLWEPRE